MNGEWYVGLHATHLQLESGPSLVGRRRRLTTTVPGNIIGLQEICAYNEITYYEQMR